MLNIEEIEVIESVYGLKNNTEMLLDLFQLSHKLMITESLFEDIGFNYDAIRLDIVSRYEEDATCDWYLEKVEGVLRYYTKPLAYVKYTDEDGHTDCDISILDKKEYDGMIKFFYELVVGYYLNQK